MTTDKETALKMLEKQFLKRLDYLRKCVYNKKEINLDSPEMSAKFTDLKISETLQSDPEILDYSRNLLVLEAQTIAELILLLKKDD